MDRLEPLARVRRQIGRALRTTLSCTPSSHRRPIWWRLDRSSLHPRLSPTSVTSKGSGVNNSGLCLVREIAAPPMADELKDRRTLHRRPPIHNLAPIRLPHALP